MERSPSWQTNGFSASQGFPRTLGSPKVHYNIYWNPPCVRVLSQINPVHAPPQPTSWICILLSSHLRLRLPSGLFPSGFLSKNPYAPLISVRAVYPAHLVLLDFITRIIFGEEYRSLTFLLCRFLQSLVTWSLLGPNILLSSLFSNNLSLRPSLNVSDQVSHAYKTTGKIIVVCILIFMFLNLKSEDEILHRMVASITCLQTAVNIFLNKSFVC